MPAHSSHKLQPLDVGCFRALKRSYSSEIEKLMCAHITHISKEDFLPAFQIAFHTTMTESNIKGGFRGSGLVPFDPEYVISQLDIPPSEPTPPSTSYNLPQPWEPQTPSNAIEAQSQSTYIKERVVRHQNSSPTSLLTSIDQFAKGTMQIMHRLTLLQEENIALRKANNELSWHHHTKKRRLQNGGSLTIGEAQALQAQHDIDLQLQATSLNNGGHTNPNPPQLQ